MDKRVLLNKLQELGFNAAGIAKHTQIPATRVRQWYLGRGLPKQEDFAKLQKLYTEYTKNPTADFVEKYTMEEQPPGYATGPKNGKAKKYTSDTAIHMKEKQDQETGDLHTLIESNKLLASANNTMAETNKELALMLRGVNSIAPEELVQQENDRILEHLAEQGATAGLWPSKDEGLVTLGKLLFSYGRKTVLAHK